MGNSFSLLTNQDRSVKRWSWSLGCLFVQANACNEQIDHNLCFAPLFVGKNQGQDKGHLVVGIYYRLPDRGEPVDETFLLQLQEVLHLQALFLMGDFSPLDAC